MPEPVLNSRDAAKEMVACMEAYCGRRVPCGDATLDALEIAFEKAKSTGFRTTAENIATLVSPSSEVILIINMAVELMSDQNHPNSVSDTWRQEP